jgi:hypothetical protein
MFKYMLLLTMAIAIGVYVYFQPTLSFNNKPNIIWSKNPVSSDALIPFEKDTKDYAKYSIQEESEGLNRYYNEVAQFTFTYPSDLSLQALENILSVNINKDVEINGHRSGSIPYYDDLTKMNDPESLQQYEIFCAADGPQGGRRCENVKFEKITNANNISGYKLHRLVIEYSYGMGDGEDYEKDKVSQENYMYVFKLNNTKYPFITFDKWDKGSTDTVLLEQIVNSFNYIN